MQHFVNEYEYTQDILKESIGSWWDWKFRDRFRSMLIISVLIAVLVIVIKQPLFLLAELVPLFLIILFNTTLQLFKRNAA